MDNLNPSGSAGETATATGIRGRVGAFAGTTSGRIVLGAIGLLIVLGALAAIVFLFLGPGGESEQPQVPPAGSVKTPSTPGESLEATPTLRRARPLASTFVFRDVFEPTVKPRVEKTDTGTGGTGGTGTDGDGTDGDGNEVPENTLLLKSVSTVDGVAVAELIWEGQTFLASEGESLGDSPWRVLEISGNTVTLLFGDTRVTLTVGQGIAK